VKGLNMADIDELSRQLGAIQSDIKHIRTTTGDTIAQVRTISTAAIRQEASVSSAHKRLDQITPKVEALHDSKNRSVGFLSAIGITCGTIGAIVVKFLSSLLPHV